MSLINMQSLALATMLFILIYISACERVAVESDLTVSAALAQGPFGQVPADNLWQGGSAGVLKGLEDSDLQCIVLPGGNNLKGVLGSKEDVAALRHLRAKNGQVNVLYVAGSPGSVAWGTGEWQKVSDQDSTNPLPSFKGTFYNDDVYLFHMFCANGYGHNQLFAHNVWGGQQARATVKKYFPSVNINNLYNVVKSLPNAFVPNTPSSSNNGGSSNAFVPNTHSSSNNGGSSCCYLAASSGETCFDGLSEAECGNKKGKKMAEECCHYIHFHGKYYAGSRCVSRSADTDKHEFPAGSRVCSQ